MTNFDSSKQPSSNSNNPLGSKPDNSRALTAEQWQENALIISERLINPNKSHPLTNDDVAAADTLALQADTIFPSSSEHRFYARALALELIYKLKEPNYSSELTRRTEELSNIQQSDFPFSNFPLAITKVFASMAENDPQAKITLNREALSDLSYALIQTPSESLLASMARRHICKATMSALTTPVYYLGNITEYELLVDEVLGATQLAVGEAQSNRLLKNALNRVTYTANFIYEEKKEFTEAFLEIRGALVLAQELYKNFEPLIDLRSRAIFFGIHTDQLATVNDLANIFLKDAQTFIDSLEKATQTQQVIIEANSILLLSEAMRKLWIVVSHNEDRDYYGNVKLAFVLKNTQQHLAAALIDQAKLSGSRDVLIEAELFHFSTLFQCASGSGEVPDAKVVKKCVASLVDRAKEVALATTDEPFCNMQALEERVYLVKRIGTELANCGNFKQALELVDSLELSFYGIELVERERDGFLFELTKWAREANVVEDYIKIFEYFATQVQDNPERDFQRIAVLTNLASMYRHSGDVQNAQKYGEIVLNEQRLSLERQIQSSTTPLSVQSIETVYNLLDLVEQAVDFKLGKRAEFFCDEISILLMQTEQEHERVADWFLRSLNKADAHYTTFSDLIDLLIENEGSFEFLEANSMANQWLCAAIEALHFRGHIEEKIPHKMVYLNCANTLASKNPHCTVERRIGLLKDLLNAAERLEVPHVFERKLADAEAFLPQAREHGDYSLDALIAFFRGERFMIAGDYESASSCFKQSKLFHMIMNSPLEETTIVSAKLGISYFRQLINLDQHLSADFDIQLQSLLASSHYALQSALHGFEQLDLITPAYLASVRVLLELHEIMHFSDNHEYSSEVLRARERTLMQQLRDNSPGDDDFGSYA